MPSSAKRVKGFERQRYPLFGPERQVRSERNRVRRMDVGEVKVGEVLFQSDELKVLADIGDGLPNITQGFGGWEEVELPKRRSLTTWKGRQPWVITLPIRIDRWSVGKHGLSIEPECRNLEKMAGGGVGGEPPVIAFDSGGLVPHDYHDAPHVRWVINGIELGATIRNPAGNRVRADFTVTLLQYVEDQYLQEKRATKRKGAGAKKGAKKKRYRVRVGDTLASIALDQLGDASRWSEIGKMQRKPRRDPRDVKVGEILRLP